MKLTELFIACEDGNLVEAVCLAYANAAKANTTRSQKEARRNIDREFRIDGFAHATSVSIVRLLPKLVARSAKSGKLRGDFVDAWLESVPAFFAELRGRVAKLGLLPRLRTAARALSVKDREQEARAILSITVDEIFDGWQPENSDLTRVSVGLALEFHCSSPSGHSGETLLGESESSEKVSSIVSELEKDAGNDQPDKPFHGLFTELLEAAATVPVGGEEWDSIQTFSASLSEVMLHRKRSLEVETSFHSTVEGFFETNADTLAYIKKAVGSFPAQETVLRVSAKLRDSTLGGLASLTLLLAQAKELRAEVAEDPGALAELQLVVEQLRVEVGLLEALVSDVGDHFETAALQPGNAFPVIPEEQVIVISPTDTSSEDERANARSVPLGASTSKSVVTNEPSADVSGDIGVSVASEVAAVPHGGSSAEADLEQSVWSLLAEGNFRVAHELARHLQPGPSGRSTLPSLALLESLVLSRVAQGDVENSRFAERLQTNLSSGVLDQVLDNPKCLGLVTVATTLKPAFLCPTVRASEPLREALSFIDGRFSALRDLARAIISFSDQHHNFDRSAVLGSNYWSNLQSQILAEASVWLDQAPHRNMIYGPATALWKEWIGKSGIILTPLQIVASDQVGQIEVVRHFVEQFSTEEAVKREIGRHQKAHRGGPIQANALRHVCEQTLSAVKTSRKWLEYRSAADLRQDSYSSKKTAEFTATLRRLCQPAFLETSEYSSNYPDEVCASKCCSLVIGDLLEFLSPNSVQEPEPDFDQYMDEVRLFFDPRIVATTTPLELPFQESIRESLELLSGSSWDRVKAFHFQMACGNLHEVDKILELLKQDDDRRKDLSDLERLRNHAVSDAKEILRKGLERAQNLVEEAVTNNVLKESVRSKYTGTLNAIEDSGSRSRGVDSRAELKRVTEIASEVQGLIEEQKLDVMNRIADLVLADEATKSRITTLVRQNDLVTAEDYIGKVRMGLSLPETEESSNDDISSFLTALETLERDIENRPLKELARSVKSQKSFSVLSFQGRRGALTDRFSEAIGEWADIKQSKGATEDQIRKILTAIGFVGVSTIERSQKSNLVWFHVSGSPIEDRQICPSPSFGSLARGKYRLLCIFEGFEESQVLDLVGDTVNREPVIVLFFRRLVSARRRNLAALCVEKRRSFLMLDDLLLLSLAASENPLRSFFYHSLPFTFSEPYLPTSSMVPREMFFGRKRELASLRDPRGTSFIFGGRQLGKTVLLREVERLVHDETSGRLAIWLDLRTHRIGYDRPLEDLWTVVGSELAKYQVLNARDVPNLRPEKLKQRILAWLGEDERRSILLLLDEADKFLEKDGGGSDNVIRHFESSGFLKGLMDETERRFKVVFAGLHNVQRTTKLSNHPLAHLGEPMCIGPLIDNDEAREAEALVRIPLESMGYSIGKDLVYRILALSNYYPSLIQLFCQELLKYLNSRADKLFRSKDTPPKIIESRYIEDAYRSENLKHAIRDRFIWTLQLDQRYEVIAYSLAFEHLSEPSTEGPIELGVARIKELCLDWWRQGFQDRTHEEMKSLLDEMAGLGVLKESSGKYSFRNTNILRLIGTLQEIEEMLIQDREKPIDFAPALMRDVRLANQSIAISPLTTAQESLLRRQTDDVHVLIVPPMVSESTMFEFFSKWMGKGLSLGSGLFSTDPATYSKNLRDTISHPQSAVNLIVYESSTPWSVKHVREAQLALRKRSGSSSCHIVFLSDSERTWQILKDEPDFFEGFNAKNDSVIIPGSLAREALRYWLLEQSEYAHFQNKEYRERIAEATGSWPTLLESFHNLFLSNNKVFDQTINVWKELWLSPESAPLSPSQIGIGVGDPRFQCIRVLHENNRLDDYSLTELCRGLPGLPRTEVMQILKWASMIGFAQRRAGDDWQVEPIVGLALESVSND